MMILIRHSPIRHSFPSAVLEKTYALSEITFLTPRRKVAKVSLRFFSQKLGVLCGLARDIPISDKPYPFAETALSKNSPAGI
ncbi:MAG: hypothetical protein HS114_19325 [Anaerolineales bacterium]|nr:hypothetical protein [Anaerolineales bacterium]